MKLCVVVALSSSFVAAAAGLATSARAQDSSDAAPFAAPAPTSTSSSSSFAPMAAAAVGFGGLGQWVVSVQSANDASTSLSFKRSDGGGWSFRLQPAIDTFLVRDLSVGGVVGLGHDSGGVTSVVIGARVGYAFALGGPVGFWPTGGVFGGYATGNHMSNSSAYLGLFAPFIVHPAAHFFLGLGPTFNLGLTDGNGKTFGLDFTLGGWI